MHNAQLYTGIFDPQNESHVAMAHNFNSIPPAQRKPEKHYYIAAYESVNDLLRECAMNKDAEDKKTLYIYYEKWSGNGPPPKNECWSDCGHRLHCFYCLTEYPTVREDEPFPAVRMVLGTNKYDIDPERWKRLAERAFSRVFFIEYPKGINAQGKQNPEMITLDVSPYCLPYYGSIEGTEPLSEDLIPRIKEGFAYFIEKKYKIGINNSYSTTDALKLRTPEFFEKVKKDFFKLNKALEAIDYNIQPRADFNPPNDASIDNYWSIEDIFEFPEREEDLATIIPSIINIMTGNGNAEPHQAVSFSIMIGIRRKDFEDFVVSDCERFPYIMEWIPNTFKQQTAP